MSNKNSSEITMHVIHSILRILVIKWTMFLTYLNIRYYYEFKNVHCILYLGETAYNYHTSTTYLKFHKGYRTKKKKLFSTIQL